MKKHVTLDEVKYNLGEEFCTAMMRLGANGKEARKCFNRLAKCYGEKHRKYHTLLHLAHCLEGFGKVAMYAHNRYAIVLAIFYHDVVYNPLRRDNEAESAKYFKFDMWNVLEIRDKMLVDKVARMIMQTKHHQLDSTDDRDCALFLDVDMSILGAEPHVYDQYSSDLVRREYDHYSDEEWAVARIEFFLDPTIDSATAGVPIFHTRVMREKYEERAIANLKEERVRLQKFLPVA